MTQLPLKYLESLTVYKLLSNGSYSLVDGPFEQKQHPNQQNGLDLYVKILDHTTDNINIVKLYENKNGLFFKKKGNHYLKNFRTHILYVPSQTMELK